MVIKGTLAATFLLCAFCVIFFCGLCVEPFRGKTTNAFAILYWLLIPRKGRKDENTRRPQRKKDFPGVGFEMFLKEKAIRSICISLNARNAQKTLTHS